MLRIGCTFYSASGLIYRLDPRFAERIIFIARAWRHFACRHPFKKTMDLTSLPIRAHKDIGLTSIQSRGMPVQNKYNDTVLIHDLWVLAEHAVLNISAVSLGTARLQRFCRRNGEHGPLGCGFDNPICRCF